MRQTQLFSAVIETLRKEGKPLSVPVLQDCLRNQGLTPNKTSLYRLLEKLQTEGQIESVLLASTVAHYELKTRHHHHFKCDNCDDIQCVEDSALEEKIHQLEDQLQASGLQIAQHQFSLSGCCSSCQ